MLLSISSLTSARTFAILSILSVCLVSIAVIARPVDQALEHDLTAPPTKAYHPEVFLRRYIGRTTGKYKDSVSLCISRGRGPGNRTISLSEPRDRDLKTEDHKLGHLHFIDEVEGDQALDRAKKYAIEWQSHPYSGEKQYWNYLNDVIMYLSYEYNAVEERLLDGWLSFRPDLISSAARSDWIGLIVYRNVTSDRDHPRPNGKLSLRIGDKWFISPERDRDSEPESSTFKYPRFIPIGSLNNGSRVNFISLGQHATKHIELLDDGSSDGAKWLLDFKERKKDIEEYEGRSTKATQDYLDEWLYTDGVMDGLWEQEAITKFSLKQWIRIRNEHLGYYVKHLYYRCRIRTNKRKQTSAPVAPDDPPHKKPRIQRKGPSTTTHWTPADSS
ncbi:hypothetical protein EV361DRAFT_911936 [Lentinula raphanica]|nr:hypothetical protein EV361DRAFT_911936 [Lentinula raphanica]